jgi:hypothetical protein
MGSDAIVVDGVIHQYRLVQGAALDASTGKVQGRSAMSA